MTYDTIFTQETILNSPFMLLLLSWARHFLLMPPMLIP